MWLLECLSERDGTVRRFHLLGGSSYSLGRKGAQLQLDDDDPSLSRHHATLMLLAVPSTAYDGSELVRALKAQQQKSGATTATAFGGRGFGVLAKGSNNRSGANNSTTMQYLNGSVGGARPAGMNSSVSGADGGGEEASDEPPPYAAPEVILLDTSKHGCYVNNQRVNAVTRKATVTRHDTLRFGAHVTARLTYCPIVATLSPTLTPADVRDAVRILTKFGCLINNPKKTDALPIDAFSADQLLTPQQRRMEAAMREAHERRLQRIRSGAGGPADLASLQMLGANFNNSSFASGDGVNQLLGLPSATGAARRRQRNLSFASGTFFDDDGTATNDGALSSFGYGRLHSSEGGDGGGGGGGLDSSGRRRRRNSTDELDVYGFESQRNAVRARPLEDITHHMSPADATALRLTPMLFAYVTNAIEVGEPTAMAAMLYGYRPLDTAYLYTLFEAIFNAPSLAPTRWPEPRPFEHPSFADTPYHKPPLFHIDDAHFHSYSTTATFRMCHFGFLQNNLYPRYEPTIVKGGGRASFIDPAKVIERLSNAKLYCNTSSVGDPSSANNDGGLSGSPTNASFSFGGADSFAFSAANFDTMSMRSGMTGFGAASSTFSRSGRRKSRSRRTKKIPLCLKLTGIVEEATDAHGANLRVVVSSSVFQYLARELQTRHGAEAVREQYLRRLQGGGGDEEFAAGAVAADGSVGGGRGESPSRSFQQTDTGASSLGGATAAALALLEDMDEAGAVLPNVDTEVIDAAIHLFDSGYLIVHEDNLHAAIYSHDTAAQIMPSSPGVLARSEIVDKAEETDSDATVGADSDDDADESALEGTQYAITPKAPLWGGIGGGGGAAPLTHDQLVRDPILHRLHYAHLHRAPAAQPALQVPVEAMRARAENGLNAAWAGSGLGGGAASSPPRRTPRRGSPPASHRRR